MTGNEDTLDEVRRRQEPLADSLAVVTVPTDPAWPAEALAIELFTGITVAQHPADVAIEVDFTNAFLEGFPSPSGYDDCGCITGGRYVIPSGVKRFGIADPGAANVLDLRSGHFGTQAS